jgi:hypothetical protein
MTIVSVAQGHEGRASMFRKVIVTITCCVLSGLVSAQEAASPRIEELIPADATVVLLADDAPNLLEQWQTSPFAQLWNYPEIKAFFAPMREQMRIDDWDEIVKEETGRELDELLGMVTGEIAFYFANLGSVLDEDVDDEEGDGVDDEVPPFALLARVGENASKLESFLEEMDEEDEEIEMAVEDYRGIDLHLEESAESKEPTEEGGWAIADGIAVAAYPTSQLRTLIDSILDGESKSSVTATNAYRSARDVIPSSDVFLVVNLEQIMPAIQDLMNEEIAPEEGAPLFLDGEAVARALGLEVLQGVFLGIDLEDKTSHLDLGVTYSQNRGLMKLLAYGPGEAPRSPIIPTKATVFGSTAFDFQTFWTSLEEIINSIDPSLLEMGSAQLQAVTSGAGIELDLRRDLLENLGGEIVTIQAEHVDALPGGALSALQTNQVLAVSIKQRESFELMLETVKTLIGTGSELFESSDYLDTTIYSLKIPQAGESEGTGEAAPKISYAVTDGFFLLCIGDLAPLHGTLVAMQRSDESVWKRADVVQALASLPSGAAGVSFQDVQTTANTLFTMLATIGALEEDGSSLVDPDAVPDSEVVSKYFEASVGGLYKEEGRIVFRSRTLAAER